jgi:hypothetical protein
MSSSYPDPPATNEAHYTPIYPASANPNAPLHDGAGPSRGPYHQELPFPKIENLNEVLQAHALHANHALDDQRASGPHQHQHPHPQQHLLPPLAHPHALAHQPKPNRLRKACDSCSIRKVKVRRERASPSPARARR